MTGVRKVFGALAGVRAEVMDTAGLGCLVTSAALWSPIAGFAAAGVGLLVLSWWLDQGSSE